MLAIEPLIEWSARDLRLRNDLWHAKQNLACSDHTLNYRIQRNLRAYIDDLERKLAHHQGNKPTCK